MSASAPPPAPPNLQLDGEDYLLLTGDALAESLAGKSVTDTAMFASGVTGGYTEHYFSDHATYVHWGDRNPRVEGTYKIFPDYVCATIKFFTDKVGTIGRHDRCYCLFKSDQGRFARMRLSDGLWSDPHALEIRKLER